MTVVHALDISIQMGRNHIAAITCDDPGGTSMSNPSGIPNTGVHNREYKKVRWGEYRDSFCVMQDVVAATEGMNNPLSPSLHKSFIPMCPTIHI